MKTSYETDVVAWANEQAQLIRAGQFDQLDLAHIAEEIEDVGKSEQRELASRMAVLLSHLLKWQFQPAMRSKSWEVTIKIQRTALAKRLARTPSLQPMLTDPNWIEDMWGDAVESATKETGLGDFPEACIWSMSDVLRDNWLPATH
jgi:hypothetical protein